ncbi:unnamed protein product [Rotaria magnacalcarata]|uniref:Uncharacterized protein n=2 Tax=Rotaria magnacalcarata TaxID=392030 RepID=A0A816YKH4_9BILA|nr:unnamed protein product [Rotaria magnacalcarata]
MLCCILFATILAKCYGSFEMNWNEALDNSAIVFSTAPDDDIYKCVSYTGAHIDISHSINQDFSDYKDCQSSGLYNLNRRDRYFKIDIDVQRSWIIEVSAIIFNGTIRPICGINSFDFSIRPTESCEINGINVTITETDRFETLSLYYDMGNLTIITTHNKFGEPPHFNINIWQTQSNTNNSYGLCKGSTCIFQSERSRLTNYQRSYADDVIILICDIYIRNYLASMASQPRQRSLHYNRTVDNVQKACRADIQIEDWPHAAAGSLEVLFVEDQVDSENVTTMSEIQANFQTNLEANLLKLAEVIALSRAEVDEMLAKMTTTIITTPTTVITETEITSQSTFVSSTTVSTATITIPQISTTSSSFSSTTKQPNNTTLGIVIGCSVGGGVLLVGLLIGLYVCIKKTKQKQMRSSKVFHDELGMNLSQR